MEEKTKQFVNTMKNAITNIKSPTMMNLVLVMASFMIILIGMGFYFYYNGLKTRGLNEMNAIHGTLDGKITSVDNTRSQEYALRDFYIKTAYNCCSVGSYKNDYVDIQVLKNLLKQGVRGLDFEIYSIDNQPIVATSTSDSYYVKETFNYLPFNDAMTVIRDYAFSSSTAPNIRDPIIIHLRIKSNNLDMYKNLALLLKGYDSILLGKEYDSEYQGQNFGAVPISKLLGKVVIIVEKNNTTYLECPEFYKFINMTSNSVFMKAIHYNDIASMQIVADELIEYNKQNMTICMPDPGSNPPNPYFNALTTTGCQLLAMKYTTIDANLDINDAFFDDHGSAFVLKPENLRYIPVTIPLPPQQDPNLAYATQTVQSDFYKFDI